MITNLVNPSRFFDPVSIMSGGYYRPSNPDTVVLNAGRIEDIVDETGVYPDATQAVSGQRPVVQSAELNGLDVARFDATNSEVLRTGADALWNVPSGGLHMVGVTRFRSGPGAGGQGSNPYPAEIRASGTGYIVTGEWQFNGTPAIGAFVRGGSTLCTGDYTGAVAGNWHYWTVSLNSDLSCDGYSDGVQKGFTPGSTDAIAGNHLDTSIGGRFDGASYASVDVAEIGLILGDFTEAMRLGWFGYVKERYAL